MSERRCTCCDLPPYSCGAEAERRQRGERAALRARLLRLDGVIAARYAGPCGRCGERFGEGDPIVRDPDAPFGEWTGGLCCVGEDVFAALARRSGYRW